MPKDPINPEKNIYEKLGVHSLAAPAHPRPVRAVAWATRSGTLADVAAAAPDLKADAQQSREWWAEFEAAARRPLRQRFRYAFVKTYKPVLDDETFRAFATMAEYRTWCESHLPAWLGYGREI